MDEMSPAVNITSPADGAHFADGQEVTVTADITDNEEIEEVHFNVTIKSNSEELIHEHYQPNNKTYAFSGKFTVASGVTYHVAVEGVDKAGNATEDEIEIIGD